MKPVKLAQCVAVVCGVWLMSAPAVLEYVDTPGGEAQRTIGPIVAAVGLIALWGPTIPVRWVNVLLAAALAVAPVVSAYTTPALVVSLATASVIVATTPFGGRAGERYGGGWRAVAAPRS